MFVFVGVHEVHAGCVQILDYNRGSGLPPELSELQAVVNSINVRAVNQTLILWGRDTYFPWLSHLSIPELMLLRNNPS